MLQAIKVKPENDQVILEEADVVVVDSGFSDLPRYLIIGFNQPPFNWQLEYEGNFFEKYEFVGTEHEGDFSEVVARNT